MEKLVYMKGIESVDQAEGLQQKVHGAGIAQQDHDRIGAHDLAHPERDQQQQQEQHLVLAADVPRQEIGHGIGDDQGAEGEHAGKDQRPEERHPEDAVPEEAGVVVQREILLDTRRDRVCIGQRHAHHLQHRAKVLGQHPEDRESGEDQELAPGRGRGQPHQRVIGSPCGQAAPKCAARSLFCHGSLVLLCGGVIRHAVVFRVCLCPCPAPGGTGTGSLKMAIRRP
ncbi:hypothetical protein [Ponticoccus litoralis]|uniref:Uncharacterized protein n=1 Tax=Ponticoccus litoralis TaxID=422297 RepID=A0AAW9SS42_9RHOB